MILVWLSLLGAGLILLGFVRPARGRGIGRDYQRMLWRSALQFGCFPLLALVLLGRTDSLVHAPAEFAPVLPIAERLFGPMREDARYAVTIAGAAFTGLALGGVAAAAASWWRGRLVTLGDLSGVLPINGVERRWCVLVAINAGVSEELFFRLLIPLLLVLAGASALAGFAVALAAFGLVHRYQGPAGVAATILFGAIASAIYLASGQLWLAMLLHAVVDLNGLIVQPWLQTVLPPRRVK